MMNPTHKSKFYAFFIPANCISLKEILSEFGDVLVEDNIYTISVENQLFSFEYISQNNVICGKIGEYVRFLCRMDRDSWVILNPKLQVDYFPYFCAMCSSQFDEEFTTSKEDIL